MKVMTCEEVISDNGVVLVKHWNQAPVLDTACEFVVDCPYKSRPIDCDECGAAHTDFMSRDRAVDWWRRRITDEGVCDEVPRIREEEK